MAQNENYSQVDLRVGTEAQFNAKVDTLPAGTLFGITDATVSKADLSTDLKNEINGKYAKPLDGIPKTDLASEVQTSLGKADSALQSHQSITTGSVNGTIAANGTNVAVKGLKALAYKDSLTKADVGLGNVDNTSDEAKPISTATQAALDKKQASLTATQLNAVNSGITSGKVSTYDGYQSQINGKYTKPSTGIPKTDLASAVQTSLGKADSAIQKPSTPTTDSAITIDSSGAISTKSLASITGKLEVAVSSTAPTEQSDEILWINPDGNSKYESLIDSKYTKPEGGIPKSDLSSEVQASLNKANTALQSHQTITTGTNNGTISVAGTNVSVKGLGSLAYKSSVTKSDVGLSLVVNAGRDSTPTANSSNYVTSGGVKSYVDTAASILRAYPVGAIYISVKSTDPGSLFGGSWTQLKDRFLLGAGATYAVGSMGGEATHKLTESEMPEHSHLERLGWLDDHKTNNPLGINGTALTVISNPGNARVDDPQAHVGLTGGSQAHNNMPPYLTVYMWKRVS